MLKTFISVSLVAILLALLGCAMIKGVSNTNLYEGVPQSDTFGLQLLSGDPVVGNKIGRMLRRKLEMLGFRYSETSPDVVASFTFDIVPAGTVSTAYTVIDHAPQTAYIWGNTVSLGPSQSTAMTVAGSARQYTKTIAVRLSRATTGDKLWDGVVSETGWCNQIFVTTPQILTLMFDGFPREQTNVQRTVTNVDEGAKELRKVFPPETNWGCQIT